MKTKITFKFDIYLKLLLATPTTKWYKNTMVVYNILFPNFKYYILYISGYHHTVNIASNKLVDTDNVDEVMQYLFIIFNFFQVNGLVTV